MSMRTEAGGEDHPTRTDIAPRGPGCGALPATFPQADEFMLFQHLARRDEHIVPRCWVLRGGPGTGGGSGGDPPVVFLVPWSRTVPGFGADGHGEQVQWR